MMIMERRFGYGEILKAAEGKKVLIWTCNTCARLCNGLGGEKSASELASRLRNDGIDIVGVLSVSASCIASSVRSKAETMNTVPDLVISMTCDTGAYVAGIVFDTQVLNPFVTLGSGYIDDDGVPRLYGATHRL